MPAGRPWYQRGAADFIMAVRGWDLEQAGAYSLILDHLNDRDRPLPDDDKFMAGLLHCSPQKWRKLRAFLIEQGKLVVTPDQYLTNPRFEREHAARFRTREEAILSGRAGGLASAARRAGQAELPMNGEVPRAHAHAHGTRVRRNPTSSKDHPELSQKIGQNFSNSLAEPETKSVENQSPSPTPPSSSARGRQSQSQKNIHDSTHQGPSPVRACAREGPGRLENADLKLLFDAVCEAAGFNPVQPAAIDRAMTQVEKWRDLDIDFDTVVIPAIHAQILESDEPTRTLGRFNARVLHEHARAKAAAKKGEAYTPPEIPILSPEGEDPGFFALRTDLLELLGPVSYCQAFNRIRFDDAGECQGDKHPLKLLGLPHQTDPLVHGRLAPELRRAALAYGYTEIWA